MKAAVKSPHTVSIGAVIVAVGSIVTVYNETAKSRADNESVSREVVREQIEAQVGLTYWKRWAEGEISRLEERVSWLEGRHKRVAVKEAVPPANPDDLKPPPRPQTQKVDRLIEGVLQRAKARREGK